MGNEPYYGSEFEVQIAIAERLNRIADALETLVEQHETRPNFIQYIQTNIDALQCHEVHDKDNKGYVKGELQKRCVLVTGHDMDYGHMDEDGVRWGNNLVATGLCGNDDPDIREKSSACVRPKNHALDSFGRGHQDSTGGEW